ncbi:MAG: 23S rRNA (adenine(2503)-C(2))-methyltransferase RlmN [Pseudomonadota bacterium]
MAEAAVPLSNDTQPAFPLVGAPRHALRARLTELGVPDRQVGMRASQLWNWLYVRGATEFGAMTNLSKAARADFAHHLTIARPEIVDEQHSSDGTVKWLIRFAPGAEAEAVYIPEADRGTLCISSQVGCTLNCTFCHTGTQRLVRNLTAGEIVSQLLIAKDRLGEWALQAEAKGQGRRLITNIVFMGMGEPLYNFANVRDAVHILSDQEGLSISKRRITLSTAGVVPEIPRAGQEMGIMLAISLHGVTDEVRNRLVPLNKKYPIAELMAACRAYPGLSNAKRITFEYVMLKGVNDSEADARKLVRLLEGIPAKINLIPFNPWPDALYDCSDWETIETFADIVNRAGYASPVRTPRGRDIMAACGQLKSASQKQRASARRAIAPAGLDAGTGKVRQTAAH